MNKNILMLLLIAVILAGCTQYSKQTDESTLDQEHRQSAPKPGNDIYPEVWSMNGHDGQGYEYKVNCGPDYVELETCFLWNLTSIIVVHPNGTKFELNKDFNVNNYSGEIT